MQNKKFSRPQVVKDWLDQVASLGSIISGAPAVIHHPVGESAKHNKLPVGMWWVIPLTDEEHKLLHRDRSEFCEFYWRDKGALVRFDMEKQMFESVIIALCNEEILMPADVGSAIQDYHR